MYSYRAQLHNLTFMGEHTLTKAIDCATLTACLSTYNQPCLNLIELHQFVPAEDLAHSYFKLPTTMPSESRCLGNLLVTQCQLGSRAPRRPRWRALLKSPRWHSRLRAGSSVLHNFTKTMSRRQCKSGRVGQISNCFTYVPNKNNPTLLRVLTVAEQSGGA